MTMPQSGSNLRLKPQPTQLGKTIRKDLEVPQMKRMHNILCKLV